MIEKPPVITPLKIDADRPLWSVMIPAFDRAHLLAGTLEAVLQQDRGANLMQIEVVDDASPDDSIKNLVDNLGRGRVTYYRQENNVGSLKNFETCLNRARGRLIHLLHSDDLVQKGYYLKMEALFEQYPAAGAAFCRYQPVDDRGRFLFSIEKESKEDGILPDWLERLAVKQRIQYCAMTVKREVYEKLGGFYGITYGEDWEMWLRIARYYPVAYTPEILAWYRMHEQSISGDSYMTAKNLTDMQWVIETSKAYLPADKKEALTREALKNNAYYGLRIANQLWHQTHSKKAVKLQLNEALKMHKDIRMYYKICKIYTKMILQIP